jgi:LTXXQ motif family protein
MKRKAYQVAFPATLVVVMVAFLSAIFFANANLSFAASGKNKSSAVARTSAVDHTEARIKQLQGALNITEDQEELWNNLTQVMRENAKDMDALTKDKAVNTTKTMNAVEHLKFHSQITEAQLNQLKKFIPPFEAFYASMSDEQKKITDTIFRTGKHGKHKMK